MIAVFPFTQQGGCFQYKTFPTHQFFTTWDAARLDCESHGLALAVPRSSKEFHHLQQLMDIGQKDKCAYVNIQTTTIPQHLNYYR